MNITGQQVAPKPAKVKPEPAYLAKVRALPCVCCGFAGGCDPHHCSDIPPENEQGLYTRLPCAGRKSGDRDAIPLCRFHHDMYHRNMAEFHAIYGVDYQYIAPTRAMLSDLEANTI